MGKFFTVTVRPELPIATLIANDKTDKPFAATDLFFDWAAFDIPKGPALLRGVTLLVRGEDGSPQTARNFQLYFAKSHSGGTAPSSLGTGNATADGTGYYNELIGGVLFNADNFLTNLDYMSMATMGYGGNTDQIVNQVLQGEPDSGSNVGYDKLYIAGVGGASNTWDFSTGSLLNMGSGQAAATVATTLTTDGTHATKVFAVGDVLVAADGSAYKNIGTVTAVPSTTSVTVDAVAEALSNNGELVVTNPLTMILSFEK